MCVQLASHTNIDRFSQMALLTLDCETWLPNNSTRTRSNTCYNPSKVIPQLDINEKCEQHRIKSTARKVRFA